MALLQPEQDFGRRGQPGSDGGPVPGRRQADRGRGRTTPVTDIGGHICARPAPPCHLAELSTSRSCDEGAMSTKDESANYMNNKSNPAKCLLTSGNWCVTIVKLVSPLPKSHNKRDTTD